MYRIIIITLICLIFQCCKKSENLNKDTNSDLSKEVYSKRAIDLNNEAMKIFLEKTRVFGHDRERNKRVINLLDSAIKIDSEYCLAYSNKVSVLLTLEKKEDAIECLQLAIHKCTDYAEGVSFLGMLYENGGDIKKADSLYIISLRIYQKRNKEKPNLFNTMNEIFLLKMLNKKDSAEYRLNNLETIYPQEIVTINDFRMQAQSFDRKRYIESIINKNTIKMNE